MFRARSEVTDALLLIGATMILVLTAQRYFQTPAPLSNAPAEPAAQRCTFAPELLQRGRGRYSTHPWRIPWAGWKDILWRTYQRTTDDRLLATAAGVVFFGLLAVFPAITALVSSYGLFADPSTIGANLQTLALMLPEGSFQIVQDQIARVLAKGTTALSASFLFGLALAIWSANAGVKAVIDALNVVYEEREKRGFIQLNLLSLAFTIGGIAALIIMVSAVVALPLALDHLGLKPLSSADRQPGALAADVYHPAGRARRALPVRAEPARGALGMAELRHAGGGNALARRFCSVVLVSLQFRKL